MAKSQLTKVIERALWISTNNMGTFGCFEVTIGWYGKERVDYLTYNTKGEYRCFEIKVSKADFYSKCHNSFVGHFGYYVMPYELYDQVKEDIPKEIGVYLYRKGRSIYSIKKAKRREPTVSIDVLKDSLIRSLCRDAAKYIQQEDESLIERLKRENSQVKRERDEYYRKYWDAQSQLRQYDHRA